MSTTINWNVTNLDCYTQANNQSNVVFTVHWDCTGVDGEYNGRIYSTCGLPAPTGEFTEFADLTKEQVLDWIWANGIDKEATEAAVQQQIDTAKNPPVVSPALPWNSN